MVSYNKRGIIMAKSRKENGIIVTTYSSEDGPKTIKAKYLEFHPCKGCGVFNEVTEFCKEDLGDKFPDCLQRSHSTLKD